MRIEFLIPKRDKPASTSICASLIVLSKDLNPSLLTKSEEQAGQAIRPATSPRVLGNQSGQVIVEYILLLIIAVAAATLMTKKLVGRDPENAGVITTAWARMNDAVGADVID